MTEIVIWLIAFAAIIAVTMRRWAAVSPGLDRMLPAVMKTHGDNAVVWSLALAVLGATTLVRPVDVLLTVIVIAIIGLVVAKLAGMASGKLDSR
ncbi:hypothetical protein [Halomonas urumqiensis]|uniref:Uncharacterized protein n=1 Tax=Halomonas urumqiensis TaxID=1684789 RepID=A0A2N7UDQ2_9GAMM|nr:hypothetical protein [Halomonas urumqiensis]PMR78588.1 hypothetical protein C1H70_17790 [Halomonas urumqiensis]PTB03732.1 hypothetical protein C6V82_04420 [Halomonas urumqiensis]GHE20047.1 hypothetical protein GCM10017767_05680 [Halomonas urumqiensis]